MSSWLVFLLSASAGELHPLTEAAVFRGQSGTVTLPLPLPDASRRSEPVILNLIVNVSAWLNTEQSQLTVSVDGVPHRTLSADQMTADGTPVPQRITLPPLASGFHRIQLDAQLRVPDEDLCDWRDDPGAWMTVSPDTSIFWTDREDVLLNDAPAVTDLRILPEQWQMQGDPVEIDIDASPTASAVEALWTGALLLEQWGLMVSSGGEADHPRLQLRVDEDDPMLIHAPAARAVVRVEEQVLSVTTRREADWSGALRGLMDRSLRARCDRLPCTLGAPPPIPRLPEARDDAAAITIADRGIVRGWIATGAGRHELQVTWPRPAAWRLTAPPRLELLVRLPEGIRLDDRRSRLTAWLGDRPLETWRLHHDDANELVKMAVALPEASLQDPEWTIRLEAYLSPTRPEHCAPIDETAAWMIVEPESAMVIPREERRGPDLASIGAAARTTRPTIAWSAALGWDAAWQLRAILPGVSPGPWDATDACDGLCVRPHPAAALPEDSAIHHVVNHETDAWHDLTGEGGLPITARRGRAVLRAEDCDDQQCQTLGVYLPEADASAPPTPPALRQLTSREAVWNMPDWVMLDAAPIEVSWKTIEPAALPAAEVTLTVRQERARDLDNALLMAIGLVGILGGCWVAWRAHRERPDGQPINIEAN
ncbi:MAG: cellulose biosynthesis cyclic di-GMP-binding regulatory protein BcsB [Myxococcota bacterium]